MNFEIWYKFGSGPYVEKDISDMFRAVFQKGRKDPPVVLVESQQEADILTGYQLIFGGELDIRIIEPESSMSPTAYNRVYLFYTFNPLERHS